LPEVRYSAPLDVINITPQFIVESAAAPAVAVRTLTQLALLNNNGDGSFGAPRVFNSPNTLQDVELADVTGDDVTDLVLASSFTEAAVSGFLFQVVRQNGDGSFSVIFERSVLGATSGAIGAGDVNQDGVADIVFAYADSGGTHGFFLTSSGGTPLSTESGFSDTVRSVRNLALLDIDNDGLLDLIQFGETLDAAEAGSVSYRNKGNDRFGPARPLVGLGSIDESPTAVGDLNGDGFVDLLQTVVHASSIKLIYFYAELYLNDGHGNFRLSNTIPLGLLTGDTPTAPIKSIAGVFDTDQNGTNDIGILSIAQSNNTQLLSLSRMEASPSSAEQPLDENGNNVPDSCDSEGISNSSVGLWNGYLNQINILEITNTGHAEENVSVRLRELDGTPREPLQFTLGADAEFDVILNERPGFSASSYGIVEVKASGRFQARLSRYRPAQAQAADRGLYDFSVTSPLSAPLTGKSFLPFNTFQPSQQKQDRNNLVANWLSLVNLASTTKTFRISTYLQNGELAFVREIELLPFERRDLDGGHVAPGPNSVGMHVIEPLDAEAPYLSELSRYGLTENSQQIRFAMTFLGKPDLSWSNFYTYNAQYYFTIPISRGANGDNYLELNNTNDHPTSFSVALVDAANGQTKAEFDQPLPAYGTIHIPVSAALSPGATGYAKVTTYSDTGLNLASVYYFLDPQHRIATAYADQVQYRPSVHPAQGQTSYNLYLEMNNWLKIYNTQGAAALAHLTLSHGDQTIFDQDIELPAKGGFDFPLHNFSLFGTAPDSYGSLKISNMSGLSVELLRLRPTAKGSVDFAVPLQLR
jgi:hypothetical protein